MEKWIYNFRISANFFVFLLEYRSNWYGQGEIIRHLGCILQLDGENKRMRKETRQQDRDGENLYYNAFKV